VAQLAEDPLKRLRRAPAAVLRRLRARIAGPLTYDPRWEPVGERTPSFAAPISQPCTYAQTADPAYARWCAILGRPGWCHRKQWEWCYIAQVLACADMDRPGRRGLGFGVGTEPIVAYLASKGAGIVATDLADGAAAAQRWAETDQHASAVDELNRDGLCPDDAFRDLVTFRPVDMNAVPDDLVDFDFTWSSCALEHLGDLKRGTDFFLRQIDCLKPGGIGVHTTEYNVSSDSATVSRGHTVLYRRRDIEALAREVTRRGHAIDVTFGLGDAPQDRHIDRKPWSNTHLKIESDGYVVTSFGLVVTKGPG
jgi:hypothetical protein